MIGITTLVFHILAVSVFCIEGDDTNTSKVVKPEDRIIGGEFAKPHEFPHHVYLFKKESEIRGSICGGSLLTTEWVLTAAHCVENPPLGLESFQITAGKHSGSLSGDPETQLSKVNEVFTHPCYIGILRIDPLINNDIALIKLATPFTLNDKVKTIQIDETDKAKPGTKTIAIGWGRIDPFSKNRFAPELKKVTLNLPRDGLCEGLIRGIDVRSQQCFNETDFDSVCQGDSGGPLLCKDGGVNFVCGISSFVGNRVNCIGNFNVFVRVFHFRNWIKEVMRTGCNAGTGCVEPVFIFGERPPRTKVRCPASTVNGQPLYRLILAVCLSLFTYYKTNIC